MGTFGSRYWINDTFYDGGPVFREPFLLEPIATALMADLHLTSIRTPIRR
jgi:hypothetical protein